MFQHDIQFESLRRVWGHEIAEHVMQLFVVHLRLETKVVQKKVDKRTAENLTEIGLTRSSLRNAGACSIVGLPLSVGGNLTKTLSPMMNVPGYFVSILVAYSKENGPTARSMAATYSLSPSISPLNRLLMMYSSAMTQPHENASTPYDHGSPMVR